MENKEFQWLSHLENSIPESAKGYSMSFYAIALEGWRRGLSLKFINANRKQSELLFELSSDKNTYKFVVSRGELITREAMRICKNKFETKEYLLRNKISTPQGRLFEKNAEDEKIVAYAEQVGYPLVIKPSDGTGSNGVIAGIKNKTSFKKSLKYIRENLGFKKVIVEEHFQGDDLRVFVIDNKVAGVIKRIPANVVGDGVSTIDELIKEKNEYRQGLPNLTSSLIKVDLELREKIAEIDYTLSTIVPKEKRVFLKSKNNTSAGGDSVEMSNELPDKIKKVAIDGVNAIPGLPHAGVDLMVNLENNKATIIEINTQANIGSLLFPMIGTAKDIPSDLIDFYFPETKDIKREELLYFDVNKVKELFLNGKIKEFVYPDIPRKNVVATRFLISGKVQGVNYGKWVIRQGRSLGLNGHVKFLENGKVSVVIAGDKYNVGRFRDIINNDFSKYAKIYKVVEKTRTSPVKLGFILENTNLDNKKEDGYFPIRLKGISQLGQKTNKVKSTKQSINKYEKKNIKLTSSHSRKITKPFRLIDRLMKRK